MLSLQANDRLDISYIEGGAIMFGTLNTDASLVVYLLKSLPPAIEYVVACVALFLFVTILGWLLRFPKVEADDHQ
jgi:hypothetical protein